MNQRELRDVLNRVAVGKVSPEEAEQYLQAQVLTEVVPSEAQVSQNLRKVGAEIICALGKTTAQIMEECHRVRQTGSPRILLTHLSQEEASVICADFPLIYHEVAQAGVIGDIPQPSGRGSIAVAVAEPVDFPLAEQVAFAAEIFGNAVVRLYDVGLTEVHPLSSHAEDIANACVVIAVSGQGTTLPCAAASMTDAPVIAVPTSFGCGTSFEGITTLLAMIDSCTNGVSVVSVDNGVAAAYQASLINKQKA